LATKPVRAYGWRDVDLRGADLTDANLRGADFSIAYLESADLVGANLSGANLQAHLEGQRRLAAPAALEATPD
jgi:uncharacterized protein YjbI with pentapeptide repeats